MRLGICVLALAFFAPSGTAQVADTPVPVLKLKSDLVVLDVVVTDQQGRVVEGLKKEDFSVYEDGSLQTVRTVEGPGAQRNIPAAAAKDRNGNPTWGDAPLTVVVLDQLNTPIEEIAYCRDQLFRYLQAQPALLSEPTSLIVLNDKGIQEATPATRDRDALLGIARKQHVGLPFSLKRGDADELLARSFALLRQIALSTRGDRGRKNVIWIGRGFPGLDPLALDTRDRESFLKAVRSTVDLLLEARVALYKIDPRTNAVSSMDSGLDDTGMTAPGVADDPFATSFSFNAFVAQTGGVNFMYRNDLAREIKEGVDQGSNFYTLSYVPKETREDGSYRKLTVRVNRPGVSVRTKEGFYSRGATEAVGTKELGFDLRQAALSGMEYNGVGIRVGDKNWDSRTGTMQVKVSVDTASLSFQATPNGAEQTTFLVTMAALDEKGNISNFHTTSQTVEIGAAQVEQIPTGHTSVPAMLVVPQKTKGVRVIVRDASGKLGTADVDISGLQWNLPMPQGRRR